MDTDSARTDFVHTVLGYYREQGRHDLPWRRPEADGSFNAYKIMVSELMLQQTQVSRVIPKYEAFLRQFPTLRALAKAELAAVLTAWSGLGYNRRARYLHLAAQTVVREQGGVMPRDEAGLVALPGIGRHTAGAILAYAYNQPAVFLETNIRTVYIHHFFADGEQVSDKELLPLVAADVAEQDPREWYWALMDYGSYLKRTAGNAGRRASGYKRQSAFAGSRRQVRGQVIRLLTGGPRNEAELAGQIADARLHDILIDLAGEGLVREVGGRYSL